MKLFYAPASPFARKVLVSAHVRGLADRIELVTAAPNPTMRDRSIAAHNPSGKVPTLLTDDGVALYDSRVICEYLDSLPGGPRLVPDATRFAVLTLQSLADEATDAIVLARYEQVARPEALRWQAWSDAQKEKLAASLDLVETMELGGPLDLGQIAVACLLGYVDYRFAELGWRDTRPRLARWFDEHVMKLPYMKATMPRPA